MLRETEGSPGLQGSPGKATADGDDHEIDVSLPLTINVQGCHQIYHTVLVGF